MALSSLALSFTERNDNIALIIQDITGTDGSTDWGVGTNISYTDIDGSSYDLLLDIVITTSDGTETTYDQIDLYSEFGPFVTYDDMVFTITADMLKVSTVAQFEVGDTLPDGIWDITYTVTNAGTAGADVTLQEDVLIYGVVKYEVYDAIRQVPRIYELVGEVDTRTVWEALLKIAYLEALQASAYVSMSEELLDQLETLENLVRNGSNNTW